MPAHKVPMADRFWTKVLIGDGCWEWTSKRMRSGYGLVRLGSKHVSAHRTAYSLVHGEIPPGGFVCHHCDNPCCVRPDHLFIGTNADNVRDMITKGRSANGSKHPSTKLQPADIAAILVATKQGELLDSIATRFGVSSSRISQITGYTTRKIRAIGVRHASKARRNSLGVALAP